MQGNTRFEEATIYDFIKIFKANYWDILLGSIEMPAPNVR